MLNFEELTGRAQTHLVSYEKFLVHKEMLQAFLGLKKLASQKGFNLEIISSFRSYERQELIWNEKVLGKRSMGIDIQKASPQEIIDAITRFSAIPGASRHHWGTDIDIFDDNKKERNQVQLTPEECSQGGEFFELHEWLDEIIDKNQSYGFYRPYDKDLGGVAMEKWHLSFFPVSSLADSLYTQEVFQENLERSQMLLKEVILAESDFYFLNYIKNITPFQL